MPELAEVARIVHFIRTHLVGKTIANVKAQEDALIFGKVGTSAEEFQAKMTGKKVVGAGQQGKYFWMLMSSPPHPVMHFGMTGWMKFKGVENVYYRATASGEKEPWPPKFWKFILEANDGDAKTEAAFVDARRLGRVRLVDCPGENIRKHTPLKENGPDPVSDKSIVTEGWLTAKVRGKKVPIKALLLDQAVISGIGNWMGDEILYHAKIHPEQYSNTLRDEQITELHAAINYVCSTSVDLLGLSDEFPSDWLFHHRWNKGKKSLTSKLPNGDKIEFITVGGRTSAIVPAVQNKTGRVAADVNRDEEVKDEEDEEDEEEDQPRPTPRGRTKKPIKKEESAGADTKPATMSSGRQARTPKTQVVKRESKVNIKEGPEANTDGRKRKAAQGTAAKSESAKKAKTIVEPKEETTPLRRGRSAAAKK
ncbi:formamidopyrimidine-DNA glycosylase [Polytolypa hystricis UAMH7299]|uniref:Formamidopyrimidine-DNA glycosylase n=1 Tax=Polytolypa hystricis (strain UAMH7299) TaxID=1447883 RepID=A0A2B7Y5H4_POLH7|nr:formamidopyrimidine-DNA glycosylase [Polytolypa hystricis UAMH7299]